LDNVKEICKMSNQLLSLMIAEDAGEDSQAVRTSELEVTGREVSELELRGERWNGFVAHIKPKRKDVNLDDVKADLDRVQGQIDTLLAGIQAHDSERFRLSQVEVSLAVSAEGSIGVATAGIQAGIALTFARLAN
jgi:hypothetical protein